MGLFIAVQWQEGQRIITVVPTDVFLGLSIRLHSWLPRGAEDRVLQQLP